MSTAGPRLERILPVALLVLSCVSVPVMAASPLGLPRLRALRAERDTVGQQVSRLSGQIRTLREQVRRIKSDPAAVERVARDELGLVRRTEVVFQFTAENQP